jgi:hypothetical protein
MKDLDELRAYAERDKRLLRMYLAGASLTDISRELAISRQRVQQIIGPPSATFEAVGTKAGWKCQGCDIALHSGQLHDQTA